MSTGPSRPDLLSEPNSTLSTSNSLSDLSSTTLKVSSVLHEGNVNIGLLLAIVNCPSGRKDRPRLIDNRDGTITVQYQPSESGLHELEVSYNEQPISGSPFKFYVDNNVPSGQVTAYGPGLSYGRPEIQAHFTIVTKDAGAGGLSLAVEGPSKAEIQCIDNKNGTCDVSYLPLVPGDYHISIKFMDKHISGSPFTAKILGKSSPRLYAYILIRLPRSGEPKKRSQICVGTTSDVPLKISETDINNLNAIVNSPSGREEMCTLKRLPNGYLGIYISIIGIVLLLLH